MTMAADIEEQEELDRFKKDEPSRLRIFWKIVLLVQIVLVIFEFFVLTEPMGIEIRWLNFNKDTTWGWAMFLLQTVYTVAGFQKIGPADIGRRLLFGKPINNLHSGLVWIPLLICELIIENEQEEKERIRNKKKEEKIRDIDDEITLIEKNAELQQVKKRSAPKEPASDEFSSRVRRDMAGLIDRIKTVDEAYRMEAEMKGWIEASLEKSEIPEKEKVKKELFRFVELEIQRIIDKYRK